MVHYPGFSYKLSKLTGKSEKQFPLLENYISDYKQLGFYFDPTAILFYTRKGKKVRLGLARIGGITTYPKDKHKNILPQISLNLAPLLFGSLKVESFSSPEEVFSNKPVKLPKMPFPIAKLNIDFNKLLDTFVQINFHEYLHVIGISERGIRNLRRMKVIV